MKRKIETLRTSLVLSALVMFAAVQGRAVPVINSFTPASGSNGVTVAISGTNFSGVAASNIVYFGGVRANVLTASANSLTVTVPIGATYAPITVTVGGLTAWANAAFMPTFNGGASNSITLGTRLDLPAGTSPGQAIFADVDGDGKPDLLVNSGQAFLSIYRNLSTNGTLIGAASFGPRVDVPMPGNIENGVLADIDGDGKLDYAVLDRDLAQVHIYRNVATPGNITSNSFVLCGSLPTGNDPRGLVVRDLDGDGLPDIAVANWADSTVMVFHNLGTTNGIATNAFAAPLLFAVGAQPQDLKAADLDGDGLPDLVTANNNYGTTNSVSLLRNTSAPGAISFALQVGLPGLPTCYWMAIGDLDGDGKPDLVVSSFDQGQSVSVYRNLATAGGLTTNSFAANVDFALGGWGNGVAIGDLDGDGKPDLAVVRQLPDGLCIFKNTSTPGSFTINSLGARVDYATGWNPNGVAIADLDGDGRPDIAFAVCYGATLSFYQNLTASALINAPATNPPTAFPPVITAISPVLGAIGTAITISGSNFNAVASSNLVHFGAVRASVVSASTSSLVVMVPAGAIFGPVTVSAGGLTAYSGQMFEPTFNGNGANITTGSFGTGFDIATDGGPGSTILADIDGDGKPDVVYVTDNNIVCVMRNISTHGATLSAASFAPAVELQFPTNGTSGSAYRVRAVDLDGDGRLDLIAVEVNGNRVSVFHNIATPGTITTNSFEPAFALIAGNDCRGVAAADLDGDGRVDIVALNNGDSTISIFQNIGTNGVLNPGSFAPPVVLGAGAGPYEAVIADLDGDGRPDLAVANSGANTVSIFQNESVPGVLTTNSIAPRLDLPGGTAPETITAVDMDGDGKLDLVAGSVQSDNVNVYYNLSTPGLLTTNSFAAPVNFGTPGWMHTVSVADFNGDGKPDLAVVGELGSYMGVFQNTATRGGFTSSSLAPMVQFGTGWNAWGVSAGDIDGDGRPDIIFCNYYDHNIEIYQNDTPFGASSTPVLAPPVISSFAPGAGVPWVTVAISGSNFSPVTASNIVYLGSVQAGVVYASSNYLVVVVPTGAMYAPISVTANGLTAYSSKYFEPTFLGGSSNITSANFAPGFNLPAGPGAGYTAVGDLDGDGRPDLVIANAYTNTIWIYRNLSTNGLLSPASFAPPVVLTLAGSPYGVKLADLDGDGRLDIIVADSQNNQVSVFQNLCSPGVVTANSFGSRVDFPVGQGPFGLAVADLNADGHPDVVTANSVDGTISVLQNTGSAGGITANTFAAHVDLASGVWTVGVVAGDLDGDGYPDLVAMNYSSSTVSIFRNLGAGGNITTNSFAPRLDLPADGGGEDVVLGDLDGDGRPDLLMVGYVSSVLSVYQNLSTPGNLTTNSFGTRIDWPTGGRAHRVALGDLNGDGRLDVTVTTELPNQLLIFQNVSTPGTLSNGSLAAPVVLGAGWNPNGTSIADLDGDGRADIFLSNAYDGNTLIYQNITPFAVPPAITIQPTNITVAVGNTATFSVVATGLPAPVYQWSFDGTNIAGATGGTLALTNAQPGQSGNYSVVVSNLAGAVVSSNAMLTVIIPPTPPTIVAQTPSQIVAVSNTVIFSVTASGSQPLYYFWSRNNALIPGATNSSYVLYNAQLADSGSTFSCLVTNAYGTASGTNASLKVIQTVANGLCNGAIVITNSSYTNFQSTLKADAPGNPQPDCVDGFGHGVWYQFTTPADGLLEVDTFGSDFDTGLGFYTGSCGALTEVACNDDAASDGTSQIFLPTSANTPMLILAGGWGSDAGNLVFHLNYYTPPGFSVEPTNESVVVSSNAVFSPVLTGTQPMSFQWYFNNAPLTDGGGVSGSTNVTLTIANVQTNEGGNYQLVASNFVGVATSTVAVLTPVILPPSFVSPPVSQSVGTGSNVNFTAVMAGTPPFSFQWSLNGTPLADDGAHIAGSATASLTVTNLTTADAGSYSLTVTNVSGAVTASATLTVMVAPAITQQPVGRSVPPGLPTVFSAAVTGIPAPNYQWQFNGANIPGATSLNYTNPAVGTNDLGFYQLVASNLMGMVVSSNAQLTFGPVAAWGRNLNNECLPPPGLSNVISVAGAYQASFGVLANGTITAWGNTSLTNIPASATNVVALAGNGATAFAALRADGTVASWGGYDASSLSNIVSLALNSYFGYALRADGTVVNWGSANYPVPSGLNHVTAIAAGSTAALALRSDGTVTAWGSGAAMNVPAGLANVTAIAAGPSFDLALKADGTVAAWGTSSGTNLPAGLTNVVAISANGNAQTTVSCLAIRADGTVVAWGDTALAGGGMVFGVTNPPAALSNLHSVGVAAAAYHGLALVNFGAPQIVQPPVGLTASLGRSVTLHAAAVGAAPLSYQWLLNGSNVPGATNTSLVIPNLQAANAGNYQLFVSNTIATAISLPAPVTLVTNKSIVFLTQSGVSSTNVYQGGIGTFYGGAVQGNGPLTYQWYWSPTNRNYSAVAGGTNDLLLLNPALAVQSGYYYLAASNAAIGVTSAPVAMRVQFARAWGNYAVSNPPVNVTNAIALATGGYEDLYGQYLALGADGKVTAWANYPAIYGETNVSALSNYFVTAISAGMEDNLALKSDGTVYAWGLGTYGETNVPAGLNQVVAISCGGYHDLALTASGTVVGWGAAAPYNFGQATNNPAATNVVAISAGSSHSLALRADGTVVAWGNLIGGTVPLNATNIIAIAAGSGFSEALRANGTVLQWGSEINNYPVPLTMSNVVAISASGSHALALRNDGTVVSWGNEYLALASNNVPSDLTNVIAIASGTDHDFALLGNRAPAFTVQPWSRSIFNSASSVWFCGKCAGAQPITYQWQFNGTNLPAATNDTLTVNAAIDPRTQRLLPLSSGVYQLVASNAYGVTSSKYALLTVLIPLNAALNNSNVNWTTTGSGLWYGETNYTHDGVSAAQSGDIGVDQQSVLQATLVTNVSGNLTFWWEVSSEPYFDTLAFSVNGATVTNISGSVNWQQVSVPVTAGTNLLAWTYSKQSIYSAGLDAGWLDQVAFFAAPKILNQPSSVRANYGATVALSVFANGTTMLGYQWQQNGARVGGNSPTLTMNNVSRAQDGTYSVTVTNAGGAAVSSNVVVTVNVPQVLGAPVLLSNGSLQFTSADEGGGLLTASELSNFQAQVSTNLVNWVTLPNALSLTNGMLLLQDSAPTNVPARFYRIVEQ